MEHYDTVTVLWISLIFNMLCSLGAMIIDSSGIIILPNETSMVKFNLVLMGISVGMCLLDTYSYRKNYFGDRWLQKIYCWIYIEIVCFVGASLVWVGTVLESPQMYYGYTLGAGVIIFAVVAMVTYAFTLLTRKY